MGIWELFMEGRGSKAITLILDARKGIDERMRIEPSDILCVGLDFLLFLHSSVYDSWHYYLF